MLLRGVTATEPTLVSTVTTWCYLNGAENIRGVRHGKARNLGVAPGWHRLLPLTCSKTLIGQIGVGDDHSPCLGLYDPSPNGPQVALKMGNSPSLEHPHRGAMYVLGFRLTSS